MVGMDNGNLTQRLRRMQGDALTCPPPRPFLTPPEAEGGRFTVTGTGSPAVAESHDPPLGREAPPPV